ncbi:hypothetical protein COB57_00155 [Candidatus Peregrinibacteria bacterium]|nr:MAG: hypothetical protein COB57_00155 [Candidatus Peregrinibacteria bacterium]
MKMKLQISQRLSLAQRQLQQIPSPEEERQLKINEILEEAVSLLKESLGHDVLLDRGECLYKSRNIFQDFLFHSNDKRRFELKYKMLNHCIQEYETDYDASIK